MEKLPQQVSSAPEAEPEPEEERPRQEEKTVGAEEEPASNGAAAELDAPRKEEKEEALAAPEENIPVAEPLGHDEPASGKRLSRALHNVLS